MLQINQLNIEKEELLKNKINSLININSKFKSEYKTYLGILKINNMLKKLKHYFSLYLWAFSNF